MLRSSFVRSTRYWWRGLLPLAVIWVATGSQLTKQIESDLTNRATAARTAALQGDATAPWGAIHVAGRDAYLEGTAPIQTARTHAVNSVDQVWGVRLVADRATDQQAVHPYLWSAERGTSQLTLTGYVPPGGARAKLVSEAKHVFPGVAIADQRKDGAGAPAQFDAMTAYAMKHLARLSLGKVSFIDTALTIRGTAATRETRDEIVGATRELPAPMSLISVEITATPVPAPIETSAITPSPAPSYVWLARRDGPRVTLSGFVPNDTSRKAILAAARHRFGSSTIVDHLKLSADGAPDGFTPAAEASLEQLARLETGAAAIADRQVIVIGLAASEVVANGTKADVAKIGNGFAAEATIVARPKPIQVAVAAPAAAPAKDCAVELRDAGNQGRIQFESWKSVILAQSMPVIEGIAGILKRCPSLRVEVSGHTDNSGRMTLNQTLSLRRAAAVVTALTQAGVDRARLKHAGFGATRPVAENRTQQGRAANRRIEFAIVR